MIKITVFFGQRIVSVGTYNSCRFAELVKSQRKNNVMASRIWIRNSESEMKKYLQSWNTGGIGTGTNTIL